MYDRRINLEGEGCEDRPAAEENNPAPAEVIPEAKEDQSNVSKKRRREAYSENENIRGQTLQIVENQTAAQCKFNEKIIAVLETLNKSGESWKSVTAARGPSSTPNYMLYLLKRCIKK